MLSTGSERTEVEGLLSSLQAQSRTACLAMLLGAGHPPDNWS